jgi:hypothetical protein
LPQIFLFVGTLLVAFQFVGDIGYVATLISMPFALPLPPLMRKLGINYKRMSPMQLGFQISEQTTGMTCNRLLRVIWWVLFILTAIIFSAVTLVTQPIMLAYLFIGRPLIGINKILNAIYQTSMNPWDIIYLTRMQQRIHIMQKMGVKTTKKHYSDQQLLKIRRKKGELPFLAFFGLLCIAAGFILELIG